MHVGGDRWPIHCPMANEVKRIFYNVELFLYLFGQFINLIVSNNICVGSNFADGDIVVEFF